MNWFLLILNGGFLVYWTYQMLFVLNYIVKTHHVQSWTFLFVALGFSLLSIWSVTIYKNAIWPK